MRILDNGVYRDMTPEEEEAYKSAPAPDSEQADLTEAEALSIILGGAE